MENTQKSNKGRSYWQSHVKAQNASGLTQREYCRQNNISYWSFNPWKRRLGNAGDNSFHEITPEVVLGMPAGNDHIEITVNEHIKITVPERFSSAALRDILCVLEVVG